MNLFYESLVQKLMAGQALSGWENLFYGFYKAFLDQNRWRLYLDGVLVTLEVTAFARLGVILGVLVAVGRTADDQQRPGRRILLGLVNAVCKVYVTVIRGTPMMVQLLIMGFVIFSSSREYTMVGALTLGINSGAYVAEIVRGGLMSVDRGQMEAGRSLGPTLPGHHALHRHSPGI